MRSSRASVTDDPRLCGTDDVPGGSPQRLVASAMSHAGRSRAAGWRLQAALTIAAAVVAGCTQGTAADVPGRGGPLAAGSEPIEACLPAHPGDTLTFGLDVLRLADGAQVTVEDVSLVEPEGLELTAADLVPLSGTSYVGTFASYPPSPAELRANGLVADWSARHSATGASVTGDSRPLNLVLGLRAPSGSGRAAGTLIRYRQGRDQFEVTTRTAVRLAADAAGCS